MAFFKNRSTPKDVIMHLLMFLTLILGVIFWISLLFQYIELIYPDQLNYYSQGAYDTIRQSVAFLVVTWPIFITLNWLLLKEKGDEATRPRKWLIYITLFAATITIIVDLSILIYNYLGGDLTTPFLLKVLVVLVLTSLVFAQYLFDEQSKDYSHYRFTHKIFAWVASVAMVASLGASFYFIGSPSTQRDRRFDETRVRDLQSLQNEIVNYWTNKNALPKNQEELKNSLSGYVPPVDPQTRAAYEYTVKSPLSFELCAGFNLVNKLTAPDGSISPKAIYAGEPYYDITNPYWSHDAGYSCFTRTIDPDLYKPAPPKPY